jgi:hypothetical protein
VLDVSALGDVPICRIFVELTKAVGALYHISLLTGNLLGKALNFHLDHNIVFGIGVLLKLINLLP